MRTGKDLRGGNPVTRETSRRRAGCKFRRREPPRPAETFCVSPVRSFGVFRTISLTHASMGVKGSIADTEQ